MRVLAVILAWVAFSADGFADERLLQATKSFALDEFVSAMRSESYFYRIRQVSVKGPVEDDWGQLSAKAVLIFDDSLGCRDREAVAECLKLGNGEARMCGFSITDCL